MSDVPKSDAPTSDARHVTIAIPTLCRPKSLERLLGAIAMLETRAAISVLVADNDAGSHAGFDVCVRLSAAGYRWPLKSMIVAERGISPARNALTAHGLKDPAMQFLAMIDDDEWPAPDWIDRLLATQCECRADVVQGSVLFDRAGAEDWAMTADGTGDIRHATGVVEMLQGAGNLLITRQALEKTAAPWFDPAFGLSGGEDRDFFVRLKRAGMRFAWSDEAIVRSDVPAVRTELSWALQRAYRIGNSDMRVFLKYEPGAAALAHEILKIAVALLLSPVLFVILSPDANRRVGALRRFFRAAGKAAALAGGRYNEYVAVHGE